MAKYYGYVWFDDDYDKWWIYKWQVNTGSVFGDSVTLFLRNVKEKKIKQMTIKSNEVKWDIVEKLQAAYPSAVYWKTKKQRWKAYHKRY